MYVYVYLYVYVYVYLYMYILSSTFKAGLGSRLIFFQLRLLIFFQAAPPPRFFFKRLQLLIYFKRLRLRFQGAKNMRLLAAPAFRSRYRSGIFFAAPAPVQAPVFFGAAPAPAPGFFSVCSESKESKTTGSGSPALLQRHKPLKMTKMKK